MAYTSPELVRRHIDTIRVGRLPIANVHIPLSGTVSVSLPHRSLIDTSVVVKARRPQSLKRERVTLNDDWVSLVHTHLVDETVIVAQTESLDRVYTANVDVLIDAQAGRVRRVSDGVIAFGQQVAVFYDHFHLYIADDDYTVDADAGTIRRRSTGAIADGQTVLVDYDVSVNSIPDSVVERAINDAADAVLAIIDPRFHDQLFPGLVIGETHLAVAAVCRMQALSVLADTTVSQSATRAHARVWTDLAQSYETSGRERLRSFAAPVPALHSPRKG
ncbi:MAG: hypothetical protein GF341_10050 [candidate division Zixibacteria bacterium]|nr:hypothetical protein [candidate division Zixibacteria bacterium]